MACKPSCPELCGKLERCGLSGEVEARECEESCIRELGDARDLDDKQTLKDFNHRRACIGTATCDEIAAGECYADDGSFSF